MLKAVKKIILYTGAYSGGGLRGDTASYLFLHPFIMLAPYLYEIYSFIWKKVRRGCRVGCKGGAIKKNSRAKSMNTPLLIHMKNSEVNHVSHTPKNLNNIS